MERGTPTPAGPSQGQTAGGNSSPGTSLGVENLGPLPPPVSLYEPEIVTGATLGKLMDLSERSIREYRAKGHIHRAGDGYDLRRSVIGMMDHYRLEAVKKGHGTREEVWREYEDVLAYRRDVSAERDRLRVFVGALIALPELPEAWRAMARDLTATPDAEEADHG